MSFNFIDKVSKLSLTFEQVIIFTTVVETGSFSAAGRKLKKVPSTISMAIANLEAELNLILFNRLGAKSLPTDPGKELYEKAKLLLVDLNQWKQQALALSVGVESSMTIAIVSELLQTDWEIYIEILSQQFPTLKFNIYSAPQEDVEQMLMNQEVQFAFMFQREKVQWNEQFIEIKAEILVPVVSLKHPLSKLSKVKFEDLEKVRQILVTGRFNRKNQEHLYSNEYWNTDNHYSACNLVLQQLGWTILPLRMFEENPSLHQQLKIIDLLDFSPKFHYFIDLVWNKEGKAGKAQQFLIDYIRKQRASKI